MGSTSTVGSSSTTITEPVIKTPENNDSVNKPAVPETAQWNGHKVTWFNKVVLFFKNHGASVLLAVNGVALLIMGLFAILGVAGLSGVAGVINISAMGNAFGNVAAMGGGVVITFLGYTKFRGKPTESLEIEEPPQPAQPIRPHPSKPPGPVTVGTSMGSQSAPAPTTFIPVKRPKRLVKPVPPPSTRPDSSSGTTMVAAPSKKKRVLPSPPTNREPESLDEATSSEDEEEVIHYIEEAPAGRVDVVKRPSITAADAAKSPKKSWWTLRRPRKMSKETIRIVRPTDGKEEDGLSAVIPPSLEPTIAQMNAVASAKSAGKKANKTVKFQADVINNSPGSRRSNSGTAYQKLVKTGAVGGYLGLETYPLEGITLEDLKGTEAGITELIETHISNGRTAEPAQLTPILARVKAEIAKREPADNPESLLNHTDLKDLNEICDNPEISLDELKEIIVKLKQNIEECERTGNTDLGEFREILDKLQSKLDNAHFDAQHERTRSEFEQLKIDMADLIRECDDIVDSADAT